MPKQSLAVLATGGAQRTVGRNGDGVQIPIVAVMVVLQLAVGQIPYLDGTIPAAGHDDGIGVIGRETHAGHPIGVTIFLNGELALSQSVPQLDGLVARAGDNLTIVSGEGNGEDIVLGVTYETAHDLASGQIPQAQSLVP